MHGKGGVLTLIGAMPECAAPVVIGLSPAQRAALHAFKHEVLAAGYRLEEMVPADRVNAVLVEIVKYLTAELPAAASA